jgi:hypothetical protein
VKTRGKIRPDRYETSTDVVVAGLDVGGAEGESLFLQTFGIPLSVALGLLKNLSGDITLSVPVAGDASGAALDVRSIVAQALRKALVGALASPLKLLGAAVAPDGKVQALAPQPIPFAAGSAVLASEGTARAQDLAGLLAASPGIALALRGAIAAADLRVLRERALLAQLQASSGVRALGALGEIGTRRTVRAYLEATLAGRPAPPLPPEPAAWLEQRVAEQALDPASWTALAAARADAAQRALVAEGGIAAERLAIGPPASEPLADQPGVQIALGTPPPAR